jgi:hypothetical protein
MSGAWFGQRVAQDACELTAGSHKGLSVVRRAGHQGGALRGGDDVRGHSDGPHAHDTEPAPLTVSPHVAGHRATIS